MLTKFAVKTYRIVSFTGFYISELVKSNLQVIHDIFTPRDQSEAKILEMPLDISGDTALFLLTNLITITPGTICLDVSGDGKTLYVQDLYSSDPDQAVAHLKQSYERKIIELMR